MPYIKEIYKDRAAKYRWKIVAPNGKKVASSGESFSSKKSAENSLENMLDKTK